MMGRTYPGHGGICGVELGSDFSDTQRDREEIECVPGPAEEANDEHEPLVQRQFTKNGKGTSELDLFHVLDVGYVEPAGISEDSYLGRCQTRESRGNVTKDLGG